MSRCPILQVPPGVPGPLWQALCEAGPDLRSPELAAYAEGLGMTEADLVAWILRAHAAHVMRRALG